MNTKKGKVIISDYKSESIVSLETCFLLFSFPTGPCENSVLGLNTEPALGT